MVLKRSLCELVHMRSTVLCYMPKGWDNWFVNQMVGRMNHSESSIELFLKQESSSLSTFTTKNILSWFCSWDHVHV